MTFSALADVTKGIKGVKRIRFVPALSALHPDPDLWYFKAYIDQTDLDKQDIANHANGWTIESDGDEDYCQVSLDAFYNGAAVNATFVGILTADLFVEISE